MGIHLALEAGESGGFGVIEKGEDMISFCASAKFKAITRVSRYRCDGCSAMFIDPKRFSKVVRYTLDLARGWSEERPTREISGKENKG